MKRNQDRVNHLHLSQLSTHLCLISLSCLCFILLSLSNLFWWQFISANGSTARCSIFHSPYLVFPFGFSITLLFIFFPCTSFFFHLLLSPSYQSLLSKTRFFTSSWNQLFSRICKSMCSYYFLEVSFNKVSVKFCHKPSHESSSFLETVSKLSSQPSQLVKLEFWPKSNLWMKTERH